MTGYIFKRVPFDRLATLKAVIIYGKFIFNRSQITLYKLRKWSRDCVAICSWVLQPSTNKTRLSATCWFQTNSRNIRGDPPVFIEDCSCYPTEGPQWAVT